MIVIILLSITRLDLKFRIEVSFFSESRDLTASSEWNSITSRHIIGILNFATIFHIASIILAVEVEKHVISYCTHKLSGLVSR